MSKIKVTELDFSQIKQNLKDYLRSQERFSDYDFDGSNLSVILDILAANTSLIGFYANMIANESFLDTAVLRESVVSRAKAIGYVPFSRRSARAVVRVEFFSVPNTVVQIPIAKGEKFTAISDTGVKYIFTVERGVVVTPDSNGRFITELTLIEGLRLEHRFTYDVSLPQAQRFVIPNENIDISSISVKVQDSATNSAIFAYELSTDINLVNDESQVFFLNEVEDQKYEIFFGDGVVGKALEDGNIVIVDYVVSKGPEANGIRSFRAETTVGGYSTIRLTTIDSANNGSERETIESVRKLAPLYYESQNRAVTRNDYETLIKKDFPEVEFVRVWGGEDNVPAMYGKVFVAIKPFGSLALSETRKRQLIDSIIRNRNLISIEVDIVEPDFLNLIINSEVKFNSKTTNLSDGDVEAKIIQTIQRYRSESLVGFNASFRYSQLVKAIDETEPSIQNNLTSIQLKYRLRPPLNFANRYVIQLNNPISRGDSANSVSAINSTAFILNGIPTFIADDGKGELVYYRLSANQRVVIRKNVGTIDYNTGELILNQFIVQSFPAGVDYLDIFATPSKNNILPQRNQILLIDDADINITVVDA